MSQSTGALRPRAMVPALLFAALVLSFPNASAQTTTSVTPPELTAPVNDFADIIGRDEEARLDSLIRALQSASGDVIVVATVKTFAPAADIRMFATEMFENRGKGIGQKGKDNGLLLLLAVDDRQVWAEVGYDLEGFITDGFAGETSRETMVPLFRQGDFGGGLVAGATVFAQRIAQGRGVALEGVTAPPPPRARGEDGGVPIVLILFVVMLIINAIRGVIARLTGRGRKRGRRRWGSSVGPFGAGYGGWHAGGGSWGGGGGGFGGGFGGFGGGRSGGGGGGASW